MQIESTPAIEPRKPKQQKGFAVMSPERQREIASRGGKEAHRRKTAHQFTSEEARLAGQIGGRKISQDKAHMAEIGRKGGMSVAHDLDHMRRIGKRGGDAAAAK